MNLLCFGYGQVAKNLVSNLLKKKVNFIKTNILLIDKNFKFIL